MRMRRVIVVTGTILSLGAAGLAFRGHPGRVFDAAVEQPGIAGVETGRARVSVDEAARAIDVLVGPVTLLPHQEGITIPVQLVQIPIAAWLRGFSWLVLDAQGNELPDEVLHHVNLIDPDRRELFGSTARRVIAAGRETESVRTPPILGYPLAAGTRLLVAAMFANPTAEPIDGATLRVRLHYSPRPRIGPEPFAFFPFHLDVKGSIGSKSFPIPPGRTVQSWEGSPAADGRVLVLGGHLHDHARVLLLEDVTAGKTLWRVEPVVRNGRVVSVPRTASWKRGGLKLHRDHVYRVTVEYENPTEEAIPHGGMGLVAGLITRRGEWPPADRADPDYAADLASLIVTYRGADGHAHMH